MEKPGKFGNCKRCGEIIRNRAAGYCTECGAPLLSKKTKKTIFCHTINAADIAALVMLVVVLIAACAYSVWHIKHVIEYKDALEPNYIASQQIIDNGEELDPGLAIDRENYELAQIYRTYVCPAIFGINALTALFAVMMLIRIRPSYLLTSIMNVIGLVVLLLDMLCCFMYSVTFDYILTIAAAVVRILMIIVLARYVKKAAAENPRRRRKKKDLDASATTDLYENKDMFYSDIDTLRRKAERDDDKNFDVFEQEARQMATVAVPEVVNQKAVVEEVKPAVPVAKAEPKKTADKFADEKEFDALSQLAAAVAELTNEEASKPAASAPVVAEAPKPAAPAPVVAEAPKPAAPAPVVAEAPKPAAPAPAVVEAPKPAASAPVVAEAPKPAAPAPAVAEAPKPAAPAPVVAEAPKPAAPAPVVTEAPKPAAPAPVVTEAPKPAAPAPAVAEAPKPAAPAPVVVEAPKPAAPAPAVAEAPKPAAPAPAVAEAPKPAAPAPVVAEAPKPAETENTTKEAPKSAQAEKTSRKLSAFKFASILKKSAPVEDDIDEDEYGITDLEPIPLIATVKADEEEITEEQSVVNRKSGPWQCKCGQMNYASSKYCMSCGAKKE